MSYTGIIVLILIALNGIVSYKGFTNNSFFEGYKFEVDRILVNKDYKRLITSGFLHVSWSHLILNMFSLFAVSGVVAAGLGGLDFLIIYFASLLGGNLLSLFIHRNYGDYSAVGASGAVCGVMFASIALYPGMGIGFLILPIVIPNWLYAIFFVLYSIYGIRSRKDNIGHDAHLGGALVGMAVALLIRPSAFVYNYETILIVVVPTVTFIYLIVTRPHILLVDNFFYKAHKDFYSVDHKYNAERHNRQQEIDRILDKIGKRGMKSLTSKELETLKAYSEKVR